MTIDTGKFVIDDVRWQYTESREVRGDRNPPERVRTGIRSANVGCKKCGAQGVATSGQGALRIRTVLGGALLSCTKCGVDEEVPADRLG